MSIFSENYKKLNDGFIKINACIETAQAPEHMTVIAKMIQSWLGLADAYCDDVYFDKTNRHRKTDADRLGNAVKEMFDELNSTFTEQMSAFTPEDYEASFKPVRIKGLHEIAQEYNNKYDDYDFGYQQGCCDVNKEEDDE